jgi:hypothetical protein
MAKRGIDASVIFNQFDLSTYFKTANASADAELLDATPFQATNGDKVFVTGFTDGQLSLEGFFESDSVTQDAVDDVLNSVIGGATKQIATVSPEGAGTLGNRCYCIEADTTNYTVNSPATGLIMSNANLQSSGGLGYGRILQVLGEVTTTGNGTSVDNGAASTNGGAGHLHITSFGASTTDIVVKIQHSTNNSTWVDLITFTTATDETFERVEVTGTVNRYLRAIRTVSGASPAVTLAVAFARFN